MMCKKKSKIKKNTYINLRLFSRSSLIYAALLHSKHKVLKVVINKNIYNSYSKSFWRAPLTSTGNSIFYSWVVPLLLGLPYLLDWGLKSLANSFLEIQRKVLFSAQMLSLSREVPVRKGGYLYWDFLFWDSINSLNSLNDNSS